MAYQGILPNAKQPSLGERLAKTATTAIPQVAQGLAGAWSGKQENEAIKRLTGHDVSGLSQDMKKEFTKDVPDMLNRSRTIKSLKMLGMSDEEAELYSHLSTGGQTKAIGDWLETRKREGIPFGQNRPDLKQDQQKPMKRAESLMEDPEDLNIEQVQKDVSKKRSLDSEINDLIQEQNRGKTPSELVKIESQRYSPGMKLHSEALEASKAAKKSEALIGILDRLNESKKLPKGIDRLNVDSEGNLRAPWFSSPETERFVKTINEFSAGAKDTFGSRVTNFDLAQYMKRYPGLLNSVEGRRQIMQQMRIFNKINEVYADSIREIYKRAGGVRKIDSDVASELAEKLSAPKVESLVRQLESIGLEAELPAANKNKGERFQDEETGNVYESNGKEWIKAG